MPKFKVLRRVKGLADGDAAKGKAPSINEPGDIVALNSDDERIDALVKSKVLEAASADAAAKAAASSSTKSSPSKPTGQQQEQSNKLDPATLQNLSVEDLRKLAADEFEFAPASIAKFTKDEMLALIAEAIAKKA